MLNVVKNAVIVEKIHLILPQVCGLWQESTPLKEVNHQRRASPYEMNHR